MKKIILTIICMVLLSFTALGISNINCKEAGSDTYKTDKENNAWQVWKEKVKKDEIAWYQFKNLNKEYAPSDRKLDKLYPGDILCTTKGKKDLPSAGYQVEGGIFDKKNLFSRNDIVEISKEINEIGKKCGTKIIIETSETVTKEELEESFYNKYDLDYEGLPGTNTLIVLTPTTITVMNTLSESSVLETEIQKAKTYINQEKYADAIKLVLNNLKSSYNSALKDLNIKTCTLETISKQNPQGYQIPDLTGLIPYAKGYLKSEPKVYVERFYTKDGGITARLSYDNGKEKKKFAYDFNPNTRQLSPDAYIIVDTDGDGKFESKYFVGENIDVPTWVKS